MNNTKFFAILSAALAGAASAGFVISVRKLYEAAWKKHTGSSFRELYEDNKKEGWDPGE